MSFVASVAVFRLFVVRLIALDVEEWKLAVAKKCGADLVLNPKTVSGVEFFALCAFVELFEHRRTW